MTALLADPIPARPMHSGLGLPGLDVLCWILQQLLVPLTGQKGRLVADLRGNDTEHTRVPAMPASRHGGCKIGPAIHDASANSLQLAESTGDPVVTRSTGHACLDCDESGSNGRVLLRQMLVFLH